METCKPIRISRERAEEVTAACLRALEEDPSLTLAQLAARIPRSDKKGVGISGHTLHGYRHFIKTNFPDIAVPELSTTAAVWRQPRSTAHITAVAVLSGIDSMVSMTQGGLITPDVDDKRWTKRPKPGYRHATVYLSDTHGTDVDFMPRTLKSTLVGIRERLEAFKPDAVSVLLLGDIISGNDVFKGQPLRNAISRSNWQSAVGAVLIYDIAQEIIPPNAPHQILYIQGNHDLDHNGNYGMALVRVAQAVHKLPISYVGHEYTHNAGNDKMPYCVVAVHGSGNSRARPQAPSFADNMLRRASDLNARRSQEMRIRRVVHGHVHWLSIDFRYVESLSFDCCGGWQRNSRPELGLVQRPPGAVLHLFSGKSLAVESVAPDETVMAEESGDPMLEFSNVELMGQLLRRAYLYEHPEALDAVE